MNELRVSPETITELVAKTRAAAEAYNSAAQTLGGYGPANPKTPKLEQAGGDEVVAAWTHMRDDVYRVLAGSAKALIAVGRLTIKTAEDLDVTDKSHAKQIDALNDLASDLKPSRPWQS